MERSNAHSLMVVLTSLILAALAQPSAAAGDAGSERQHASATRAASIEAKSMPSAKQSATHGSPVTLFVEGPTGNAFRLVYMPREGWRLVDDWRAGDRHIDFVPEKVALTTTTTAPLEKASAGDAPLTVFIDGPTGFTYVWIRHVGWKFVGHLAD